MKIRLLENVTHAGLNGCKGQVLELDDKTAIDLEKQGHAEFYGDDAEAVAASVRAKKTDQGEASDDSQDLHEEGSEAKSKKKKK